VTTRNSSSLATNSLQGFSCPLPPNRAISAGPLVSCNRTCWGIVKNIRFNPSVFDWRWHRYVLIDRDKFIKTKLSLCPFTLYSCFFGAVLTVSPHLKQHLGSHLLRLGAAIALATQLTTWLRQSRFGVHKQPLDSNVNLGRTLDIVV